MKQLILLSGINIAKLRILATDWDTEKILNTCNIKTKKDKDGKLIIAEYKQPNAGDFEVLGINEDRLFKDIKIIEGDADFLGSEITDLGILEKIGGNADFFFLGIKSLGNLKTICGNASFSTDDVLDLSNLEVIEGDALFWGEKIENLGKLHTIGGNVKIENTRFTQKDFENIKIKGKFEE